MELLVPAANIPYVPVKRADTCGMSPNCLRANGVYDRKHHVLMLNNVKRTPSYSSCLKGDWTRILY